jgi:dipeptide transport system ATP-binding protein
MGEVLSVSDLTKVFDVRKRAFSVKKHLVHALNQVSFQLQSGRTLGIVGESGSGKSTLARCVLLIEKPDKGDVVFMGKDITAMTERDLWPIRGSMQMIFQDPYSSLNPRKKVYDAIAEPLLFHNVVKKPAATEKVVEILRKVGLSEDFLNKFPHEMSGGQRQRIAIGRAIATDPVLIVADEPVSSLDVSIQAQIINLFIDIKEALQLSMLFVSHDLNIVRFIADEIIVMYAGHVLESGSRDEVFSDPLHPYTKILIEASRGEFAVRDPEELSDGALGCLYYGLCETREPACMRERPVLKGQTGHKVACFHGDRFF